MHSQHRGVDIARSHSKGCMHDQLACIHDGLCQLSSKHLLLLQPRQDMSGGAYIPLGPMLCGIELAHDHIHILEEVLEEGLLGFHFISCLLAILHGSIPGGQGEHEPHLPYCKVLGQRIPAMDC